MKKYRKKGRKNEKMQGKKGRKNEENKAEIKWDLKKREFKCKAEIKCK